MRPITPLLAVAVYLFLLVPSYGAPQGIILVGRVSSPDGAPAAGAMVTATGRAIGTIATTVFSGSDGRYRVADVPSGSDVVVRASKGAWVAKKRLPSHTSRAQPILLDLQLSPAEDRVAHVAASEWLRGVPNGPGRDLSVLHCSGCHQMPDARVRAFSATLRDLTREGRRKAWDAMAQYMRIKAFEIAGVDASSLPYESIVSDSNSAYNRKDQDLIADFLADHLPMTFDEPPPGTADAPFGRVGTVIREYEMPNPAFYHDMTITKGPKGGITAWAGDWSGHKLVRLDPETGESKIFDLPAGGKGPHTLVPDDDGNIWMTFQFSAQIARFDPLRESWKIYEVGNAGFSDLSRQSLVHSFAINSNFRVAFDRQGFLWANLAGMNRLARLNCDTGKVESFGLPQNEGSVPFRTTLYSLALTSDRKYLWFDQLVGSLGVFNTETLEVEQMFPYPEGVGLRRMAIDDRDVLWVPLYGSGQLLEFDTRTRKELALHDLPDRAAGPYAVSWDAKRRVIWIAGGNANRIYRFDPKRKSFTEYPLPRHQAMVRALPVDPETGSVWSVYANPTAIKGPAMVVQLQPGGRP